MRFCDCREDFYVPFTLAATTGCGGLVGVVSPLVGMSKREVVAVAATHPPALAAAQRSWSCYRGGSEPCGVCSPCVLRGDAFTANDIDDDQGEAPVLHGGDPHRERRL